MKALRLFVLTATLLLSARCSDALPLDNDLVIAPTPRGTENPRVETPDRPCGGFGITLSVCK